MYWVPDMGLGGKVIKMSVTWPGLERFHPCVHGDAKKRAAAEHCSKRYVRSLNSWRWNQRGESKESLP